jgi:hypothetical protein
MASSVGESYTSVSSGIFCVNSSFILFAFISQKVTREPHEFNANS